MGALDCREDALRLFVWSPLTLAVEGEASRSVCFLRQVSHPPAGPISTTQRTIRLSSRTNKFLSFCRKLCIIHLLQCGIREIQVSYISGHHHGNTHLHCVFMIHKPLSIGCKASHVPLSCNLKKAQKEVILFFSSSQLTVSVFKCAYMASFLYLCLRRNIFFNLSLHSCNIYTFKFFIRL